MSVLTRSYRRLLLVLPRDMRVRFGEDMVDALETRLDGARGPRRTAIWMRAVLDLLVHAVAIRIEDRRHDSGWREVTQDARFALRGLRSSPVATAVSVLTLALGIGASTATFSVVKAALLERPPVERPDDLVFVWPEVNANKAMVILADEMMPSLSTVSGMSRWTLTLLGEGDAREVTGMLVTPTWFQMLGVRPALGSVFPPDADLPGQAGVTVLSHDLWVSAFGADPGVVGRVIQLGGAEYDRRTVLGVMPPGVDEVYGPVDLWIPLEGDRALSLNDDNTWYVNDRLARLAPGASLEQAQLEVQAYASEVQRRLPSHFAEDEIRAASVQRMTPYLTRTVRGPMWATLGTVVLVLLIGCFNVANLQLARADRRNMDYAVRVALGAGRRRMARMLLFESLFLSVLAGSFGVLVALAGTDALLRLAPSGFLGSDTSVLQPSVLTFGVVVSLLSALAAGVAPAWRVSRARATATLGRAGRSGPTASRWASVLVSTQMALAVIVVTGAGLMLRSLDALFAIDTGLDAGHVVTFKPNPPASTYPDAASFRSYYQDVLDRVGALRSVTATGGINLLPGTTDNWSFPTHPEGFVVPSGEPTPSVNFRAVRGDYHALAGIDLIRGRYFTNADRPDAEPVAVVNQAFVDRFWPDREPLGASVRIFSANGTPSRVVGVVESVHQHGRLYDAQPEMYFPHEQVPWDQMSMWIMARIDPSVDDVGTVIPTLYETVRSIDPDVPVTGMTELSEALGRSTRQTSFLTALLAGFGAIALLLSAIGVFGVTMYTTGRRRAEFGVRLALGSSPLRIVEGAIRRSIAPALVGLAVGLVVAARFSELLGTIVYDVDVLDPLTFLLAPTVLIATAVLAAAVPASLAGRVDPATALGDS